MIVSAWYYDWEYWNLYHKVTFDGRNKLILVNNDVTFLDWKEDVYSPWKEWAILQNHPENLAFDQAMRSTGGDFITADGSRRVGGTFFLMNGWRLKTWSGNHRLSIEGNVYTEEGDPIYVPHDGAYGVIIEQTLSSLVETVNLDTSIAPTVDEIAGAVWDRIASSNVTSGTFGQLLNLLKTTSDANAAGITSANTKLDTVETQTASTLTQVTNNSQSIDDLAAQLVAAHQKLDAANAIISNILKHDRNKTKIDQAQKTMTVYDDDGTTPLHVFDLKDFAGQPSITQVAERVPR